MSSKIFDSLPLSSFLLLPSVFLFYFSISTFLTSIHFYLKQAMPVPSHLPRQRRDLTWLWESLSLLSVMVSAQQGPVSAYGMAYTTVDDNTLYVQGGMTVPESGGLAYNTTQFYSLDLTQTGWDTLNPLWKALTYPASLASISSTYGHPSRLHGTVSHLRYGSLDHRPYLPTKTKHFSLLHSFSGVLSKIIFPCDRRS